MMVDVDEYAWFECGKMMNDCDDEYEKKREAACGLREIRNLSLFSFFLFFANFCFLIS